MPYKSYTSSKRRYKKYPTRKYAKRKPVRKYKRKTPMYRKPKNNTIEIVLQNPESTQAYFTPLTGTVSTEKIGSLSNYYQQSDTTGLQMSGAFQSNPEYLHYKDLFRYVRVSKVVVKLIPETWTASSPDEAGPLGIGGEKPKIHYINDSGQTADWITSAPTVSNSSILLSTAESFGKTICKEKQFTKPCVFNIKPFWKQQPLGNGYGTKTVNGYVSCNSWVPTGTLLDMTLPDGNFFFGFTNVPTGWKYRTEISYTVVFKDPYYIAP